MTLVTWQANDLSTAPPSRQLSAVEDVRIDIDVTAQLGAGETVDGAVVPIVTVYPLTLTGRGAAVTGAGLPAASWQTGDVIRQRIVGGTLTYGTTYELVALWAVATVTDRRVSRLILEVVA